MPCINHRLLVRALWLSLLVLPGLAQAFYIYSEPGRDWENNQPLMLTEGQAYSVHPEPGFELKTCDLHTPGGDYHSTLTISANVANGLAPVVPAGESSLSLRVTCLATDTSQSAQRFDILIASTTPVLPVSDFLVGIEPNEDLRSGEPFAIYPLDATHTLAQCTLTAADGSLTQTLMLSNGRAVGLAPALPAGVSRFEVGLACTAAQPAGAMASFSRTVVPGSAPALQARASLATDVNGLGTLQVTLTPPAGLLGQSTRFWVSAEFIVPGATTAQPLRPLASQFMRVNPETHDGAAWLPFTRLSLDDYLWQTRPFEAALTLTVFDDLPSALLTSYRLRIRLAYWGAAGEWTLLSAPLLDCRDGVRCAVLGE